MYTKMVLTQYVLENLAFNSGIPFLPSSALVPGIKRENYSNSAKNKLDGPGISFKTNV
jgi:hypothetical protein